MAFAIVSAVAEKIRAIIEDQIPKQVNLEIGIEKELQSLSSELKTIGNVLDDAERRRFKDKNVKHWLKRLEDASYELDDVLDEWSIEILKLHEIENSNSNGTVVPLIYEVRSWILSSHLFFKKVAIRRDISTKIENAKSKLDLILAEKDRFGFLITNDPSHESHRAQSTSLIDFEEVHGRDSERENLVSKLMSGEELGIPIYSIVGVGGLGKTTLAKLAYNDTQVEKYFDLRIWICVGEHFNEIEIANGVIERARGRLTYMNQLDVILTRLEETISGKKFLLVLDDVWTQDCTKWEPLRKSLGYGGAGSKILVTTRNVRVAIMMGSVTNNKMHRLGHLSDEDCWLLLSRIALSGMKNEECEKFQSIGKKIAKKCKGLPLAAKILGGLLRFKNSLQEWENVLNSEIWDLEEVEVELFPYLILSYNELSPTLKRCFSYCAIFPKNFEIDVHKVTSKWMALGYLESNESTYVGDWQLTGREYFHKLATRSLFHDFKKGDNSNEQIKSFKMHDILHDFAQFLRKDGEIGARMKETACETCSPLLVSHVNEYRSFFFRHKEPTPHLCDCLISLRLLGLRYCGLRSIPEEIRKLIRLRWLDLGGNKFPSEDLKTICKLYNLRFLWVDYCGLKEIPVEIGNLIQLKHLDLGYNDHLDELPSSICNLRELESLNVEFCRLSTLPEEIHRLTNLKHLNNHDTSFSQKFPQGLAELTRLRTLSRLNGGFNRGKLGWLKNLNRLSGSLGLGVELDGDSRELVEDAREAELGEKIHIQKLELTFLKYGRKVEEYAPSMDIMDALQPHPDLQYLLLNRYWGAKLSEWISSPVYQIRSIELLHCRCLLSLPPLGKLPLLENLDMYCFSELQFVGRDFLGISSSSSIGFPKLKTLRFYDCPKWEEWEDITAEEEDSDSVSLMPCLKELSVKECGVLMKLPHRLMRKALPLERLETHGSTLLKQVYEDKEGEDWKSISHNGQLNLICTIYQSRN